MKIEYFDSHAHYDDSKFDEDRKEIIQKMYDEGVTKIISAGVLKNELLRFTYLNSTTVTPISPSPKVPILKDLTCGFVFKKV